MLDRREIRENPDAVKDAVRKKGIDLDVDELLHLDRATRRNRRRLPHLPQCGTASRTKCDVTPAAKAGSERRASAPISAPDKT